MHHNRKAKPVHRSGISEEDVTRALNHFQRTFRTKTQHFQVRGVARKGTVLYDLQTDFAYLLNELRQGYRYKRPAMMGKINEFLNNLPETNA